MQNQFKKTFLSAARTIHKTDITKTRRRKTETFNSKLTT